MGHHQVDQHLCTLKEVDTTGLSPLPPNSSAITKLLRSIRKWALLDTTSKQSRNFFRNKSAMIAEKKRHAKGYFFVVHPFSKLYFIFQCFFFMAWTYSIFCVYIRYFIPLQWSFALLVTFRIIDCIQLIVILSFFLGGYVDHEKKTICIEPKTIVWRYVKTYFVFDMIAVCLDDVVSLFVDWDDLRNNSFQYYYPVATAIMMAYLIRVSSMMSVLHNIVYQFNFGEYIYFLFSRTTFFMFCLNASTCIVASLPKLIYGDNLPAKIWLVQADVHILQPYSDRTVADLYCETLLLVTSTFFGLSYGMYPVTEISDYVPLMIIRMFGRLFTLYTLADFLKYFGLVGIAESKYEQYLAQINEFMNSKNLSEDLRLKILTYYEFKMQRNFFDEKRIMGTLSDHLRTELFLYGAKRWIDKTPLLKNLGHVILGGLFAQMTSETLLPNDILFDHGVVLDKVYFVACGTILLFNKEGQELGHYTDGEEIAVINMWTGRATIYRLLAGETTEIYTVHKKVLMEFLSQHAALSKYYEKRALDKASRYADYEELLKSGGSDVIAQLREKKILEKRNIRQRIFD